MGRLYMDDNAPCTCTHDPDEHGEVEAGSRDYPCLFSSDPEEETCECEDYEARTGEA